MFRHTYRAWLDETGAPVEVQQKLMRHAHVSTTMDQYGNASALAKRKPIAQSCNASCKGLAIKRSPFNK
jgi:integrase